MSVPEAANQDVQSRALTRHPQVSELPVPSSRGWGRQPDKEWVRAFAGSEAPSATLVVVNRRLSVRVYNIYMQGSDADHTPRLSVSPRGY